MDSVLRAIVIYVFLLVLFRIAGMRALTEVSSFEFVLLLVVGEATQQAVLGNDYSLTNAMLVIATLVLMSIGLTLLKQRSRRVKRLLDGVPVVLVENGRPVREAMQRERVVESDIMAAARELQGLERMDQIRFAVLETTGGITVIPAEGGG